MDILTDLGILPAQIYKPKDIFAQNDAYSSNQWCGIQKVSNVNFLVTFMWDGHMLDGQNAWFTFDGATIFELSLSTTLCNLGLISNLL